MIAQIILNSNAKDLDRTFDYEVPEELKEKIKIGSLVFVPFGNRKKLEEGYVIDFKEKSEYKTKPIASVENNSFLDERKVNLAKWISKRYFCNLSDSIKLMLPPGTKTKNIENRIKEKTNNFVFLKKAEDEIEFEIETGKIKSEKQIRILRFLMENDAITVPDLEVFTDTSRAIIKTLEKNGYIEILEKQVDRNPFINKDIKKTEKLVFTKEQQEAYNKIEEAIEDKMNSKFLIYGVTGSRKNRNLSSTNRKNYKYGENKYYACSRNFTYTSDG